MEELAAALAIRGQLRADEATASSWPLACSCPSPRCCATLCCCAWTGLPEAELRLLELAAVAGHTFDMVLAEALAGSADGFEALLERGLLVEAKPGRASFRHALAREAIYSDISWVRRRALHRQIAAGLESAGAPPQAVAEHWLAAREIDLARAALLLASRASYSVHAYRDAADAAQRALDLWPDGVDEAQRLDVLDQLGHCAQLCGMLPEAARAWREGRRWPAAARRHADIRRGRAQARQRCRAAGPLGSRRWRRARRRPGFAASDLPGEAATERLSAASHLRSAGHYRTALEVLATASEEAKRAGRWDLQACIHGQEGSVRARMGQAEEGLALVRAGLALALEHNLASAAAEIYQRLADALEHRRGLCRREGDLPHRVRLLPGQRRPCHRPALRRLPDGGAAPDGRVGARDDALPRGAGLAAQLTACPLCRQRHAG